jgi:hypothetical protein
MPTSKDEGVPIDDQLDAYPTFAEQLGHVCVAWARLENRLFILFQMLSGAPMSTARSAFYSAQSHRSKIEMLKAVAVTVLKDTEILEELDCLLGRIHRTSTQRNQYVHDMWTVVPTAPPKIAQHRLQREALDSDWEEVTLNDLKQLRQTIDQRAAKLNEIIVTVEKQRDSLLKRHREQPYLTLRFAKKGALRRKNPAGQQPPPSPSQE